MGPINGGYSIPIRVINIRTKVNPIINPEILLNIGVDKDSSFFQSKKYQIISNDVYCSKPNNVLIYDITSILSRSQSFTVFPDGCGHKMKIEDKRSINKFILTPYIGENEYKTVVFIDKFKLKEYKELKLGYDATRSLTIDNAGGNSDYSEAISIHYFKHGFGAIDFILENEVEYWKEYKMVDYICTIQGERIGISVTRAMGFPCSDSFTKKEAKILLTKKINGLIVACDLVIKKHSFTKSILHIWCQNERIANMVKDAYERELKIDGMGLRVLCDVTVILTICNNKDIYTNRNTKKNMQLVIN